MLRTTVEYKGGGSLEKATVDVEVDYIVEPEDPTIGYVERAEMFIKCYVFGIYSQYMTDWVEVHCGDMLEQMCLSDNKAGKQALLLSE